VAPVSFRQADASTREFHLADLATFEVWLKYQLGDVSVLPAADLALWRSMYEDGRARAAATPACFSALRGPAARAGCD